MTSPFEHTFLDLRTALLNAPLRPARFPFGTETQPEQLRARRADPFLSAWLAEVRAVAARARQEDPPALPFSLWRQFGETGERLAFERPYFERRRRLLALALEVLLDSADPGRLEDHLWAICDEYSWCLPAHAFVTAGRPFAQTVDLMAAGTAHTLAECASLLAAHLDAQVRARVRDEIERRVLAPLFNDPTPFFWESFPNNWAAVCAGSAGMAALLMVDDRERLSGLLDRVHRALRVFLTGYGADGGCVEGPGYWTYGFGYFVYYAEMLRDFTAGTLDLLADERVRAIARFPARVSLGAGQYLPFSDTPQRALVPSGLLSRLARRVPDCPCPPFHEPTPFSLDPVAHWGHATRTLWWTEAELGQTPLPEATRAFLDLAWVLDRGPQGEGPLAFAAKGGHNGEPHNHNDLGHFIVFVGDEALLADLGAGEYTRQYFNDETRYEHLHNGSQGHSVPRIAGQGQQAGQAHAARVTHQELAPGRVRFELDLTDAYGLDTLTRFSRRFEWTRTGARATLLLRDQFEFSTPPERLDECFVSLRRPEVGPGETRWVGERGTVTLRFDPAWGEPEVKVLEARDHAGELLTVYRLRLTVPTQATLDVPFTFHAEASVPAPPPRPQEPSA